MPFSQTLTLNLLDGSACALLAAAAACRARGLGAHFTGSIVLGCICGLFGPILREAFLHGHSGTSAVVSALPDEALVGAIGAICALYFPGIKSPRLFFWLDNASLGLASCSGTIVALPELGIAGALCIGLANGLGPGLLRDIALGDTAMLVDKSWYAMAAAIGCVISIGVFVLLSVYWVSDWTNAHFEICAIIVGFFTVICLRSWKGANDIS